MGLSGRPGDIAFMKPIIIAVAALAGLAAPALAQDYNGSPNFGEVHLQAGFTPDPHLTSLRAGGSIDAATRFNQCQGYITNAPDVRLHWSGSSSLSLKISAQASADVTLVVNGPNGQWYCDDDSGEGTNPSLTLKPEAGRYEIWVGTYSSGETQRAILSISELESF